MKYEVLITRSAENDLAGIYEYVFNDSQSKADRLFENIKNTILELEIFPNRGHIPPELDRINVSGFLEVNYKSYRIFYQVFDKKVYIHCILDSRRNLLDILQKRLIR